MSRFDSSSSLITEREMAALDLHPVAAEAQIITRFNLPDQHCGLCHESGNMSVILVDGKLIDACCSLASNYNLVAPKPGPPEKRFRCYICLEDFNESQCIMDRTNLGTPRLTCGNIGCGVTVYPVKEVAVTV